MPVHLAYRLYLGTPCPRGSCLASPEKDLAVLILDRVLADS